MANPYLSSYYGYDKGWDYYEDIMASEDMFLAEGKKAVVRAKLYHLIKLLCDIFFRISPELVFKVRYWTYKLGFWRTPPHSAPSAKKINGLTKEFVSNTEKPFFALLHYLDVHTPYMPYDCHLKRREFTEAELLAKELPGLLFKRFTKWGLFRRFAEKHIEESKKLYKDGIRYVGEQINDLVKYLKEKNLYQDTIIVITADHGDEFLEHGEGGHSYKLYNELLRVPLVIKL